MESKIIFTKFKECNQENVYIKALVEDNKISELSLEQFDNCILNNIYVAKVKNIVKNLNAAFVDIGNDTLCYYSITENKHIFLNVKKNNTLNIGDEILVQVCKEGIKTKLPVATSAIKLTGVYVIITSDGGFIGVSKKLPKGKRTEELKELGSGFVNERFGIIFRTNSFECDNIFIQQEIAVLSQKLEEIFIKAKFSKPYSLLYKAPNALVSSIIGENEERLCEIITDEIKVFEALEENLKIFSPNMACKLRFYDDDNYSLNALYSLNKAIENNLNKKVWLKSGGYLIIEQTEAMVVIDVNTGKAVSKKNQEANYLSVNLEAAVEIGKQLRLRNLSGIIMIDFINLANDEDNILLVDTLCDCIRKDKVSTSYIDITKLNLIEITRKKIKKSFYEQYISFHKKND